MPKDKIEQGNRITFKTEKELEDYDIYENALDIIRKRKDQVATVKQVFVAHEEKALIVFEDKHRYECPTCLLKTVENE